MITFGKRVEKAWKNIYKLNSETKRSSNTKQKVLDDSK